MRLLPCLHVNSDVLYLKFENLISFPRFERINLNTVHLNENLLLLNKSWLKVKRESNPILKVTNMKLQQRVCDLQRPYATRTAIANSM